MMGQGFTIARIARSTALACTLGAGLISQPGFANDDKPIAAPYVGLTGGGNNQDADRTRGGDEKLDSSTQLSSKDDQISADFSLDYRIASQPKLSEDGNYLTGSFLSVSVKGSVPLNDTGETAVVDFKTFGTGGNVSIGFNYFKPRVLSSTGLNKDLVSLARYCVTSTSSAWENSHRQVEDPVQQAKLEKDRAKQVELVKDRFDASVDGPNGSNLGIFEHVDEAIGSDTIDDSLGQAILQQCTQVNPALTDEMSLIDVFAKAALSTADLKVLQRKVRGQGTWFMGGKFGVGYNRFEIVDRTTLTTPIVDRIGFDVSGHFGRVFGGAGVMLIGNVGYTRKFQAQPVVDVCGPPDLSGKSVCKKGQDGPPVMSETGYAGATVRWVVARNSKGEPTVGIRPSATYIFEDKDWQFELPVYFQRSSSGGLDAGVRGIYNTGSKDFGIGAFVGLNF